MIVTKTYISKSNTLVKNSFLNLGLNPVMELNYGTEDLSRCIIYFDHTKVKELVVNKTYPDINKLKHILHITNAASVTNKKVNCGMFTSDMQHKKQRATSFDLIFFLIPNEWDGGHGYMYYEDLYNGAHTGVSTKSSNWYQCRDYFKWGEEGIYSTHKMLKEMELFTSKEGNLSPIIFAYQHFDYGNEDICLDITCIFNKFLTDELPNYGIGIAFAPSYETTETELSQYVGFFTQYTHSFFEPYVETIYNETIEDDRSNFYIDKDNKLYFYSIIGGQHTNLDYPPTCTINGTEMVSKQATKGIYYVDIKLSSDEYETDTMIYDVWSNITYKGKHFKDVELSFTTKSEDSYFNFGLPSTTKNETEYVASISGIGHNEIIQKGDIRKLNIICRVPYTSNNVFAVDNIEYRLYVNEGTVQHTVIDWQKAERGYNENFFLLNTNDLLPAKYFLDIRITKDMETKNYYKMLTFDIVNDITEIHK